MRFTIINGDAGDDSVIVNGRTFFFVVDNLLSDKSIWAVQWYGENGEIEYSDGKPNLTITSYLQFQPILDEWERKRVEADAPPPPPPTPEPKTQFSSLEYLDRFTQAEQEVIIGATYSNVQIKLYYDRLLAATFIDLDDPRTEAGIDALIAAELLAPERKAVLLEPEHV